MPTQVTTLAMQLRNIVLQRTNRSVWNLNVEVSPERVVLRGDADTYYAKQLAQESVRKLVPTMTLQNAIEVAA
ncbi:MAG: BON domain-containing protein [Planctomycetes bacterium]|nr:BON domain-containing protein [Planctomycetota bacterium]